MSERPTPDEIAYEVHASRDDPLDVLYRLRAEGYRIVRPDDVPDAHDSGARKPPIHLGPEGCYGWESGWNACRAAIFGEDA